MKRHILFVLDYYLPHRWWAETVFQNIINLLSSKWYNITILTSRYDRSLTTYTQTKENITIHRIASSRKTFQILAIIKWLQIIKSHPDISIIHTSTYWWAIPARFIAKITWKKNIITVHEVFGKLRYTYKSFYIARLYLLFEKLIFLLKYDNYHTVSHYTSNSIRLLYNIDPDHTYLVHNHIDRNFRDPSKISQQEKLDMKKELNIKDQFVILYYWHSGMSKWLDYLIQAIPEILEKYPDSIFICNLIHAQRDKIIKEKISQISQQSRIILLNGMSIEKLRTLLSISHCVIAPSISEWFWSVHAETSSMQIPLITTYASSIPEVVFGNVIFVKTKSPKDIIRWFHDLRKNKFDQIVEKEKDIITSDTYINKIINIYHHTW